jgi:hypothetical protein
MQECPGERQPSPRRVAVRHRQQCRTDHVPQNPGQ